MAHGGSAYPVLLLGKLLIRCEELGLVLGSVELEEGDAVDELGHVVGFGDNDTGSDTVNAVLNV